MMLCACVIPGCAVPVDQPGDTCTGCVAAFGAMLRPTETRLTAEEIEGRDTEVAHAYHTQKKGGGRGDHTRYRRTEQ